MRHEFLKDSDMGEERDTCDMSFKRIVTWEKREIHAT